MKDTLLLVSYFAGWRREVPNFWHDAAGDWRPRFPGLVPLLGEYNEQDTTDREIAAAADYGIDAFLILWYYKEPGSKDEKRWGHLNAALPQLMNSPHSERMKFAIEWCNHEPYQVTDEARWEYCIQTWLPAFCHPSYLRVGGRLVFKVHTVLGMVTELGGDIDAAQRRIARLRAAVREAGLGEMVIAAGGLSAEGSVSAGDWVADTFDFTGIYNQIPPVPQRPADYPYDDFAAYTNAHRMHHEQDVIPYMPYMAAGWNRHPWPDDRPYYCYPTRGEWTRELRRMQADLDASRRLGIPLPDGSCQKAFTIFAWNEFGEGGIVAPTRGDGWMKLEAIREVFAPAL